MDSLTVTALDLEKESYSRFLCNELHFSPKLIYIWQLLTMDHDCLVAVDKHNSVKNFTPFTDPLYGVKGQIFKFLDLVLFPWSNPWMDWGQN